MLVTKSTTEVTLTFWQILKDYQSIIGGVLNAAVATLIALFVTRRVVERGRIAFYLNSITVALFVRESMPPGAPYPRKTFESATEAKLELSVDLYNSSGVRRIMRDVGVCMLMGRDAQYIRTKFPIMSRGDVGSSRLSLDPKELTRVTISLPLSESIMKEIRKENPILLFTYRNERNKLTKFAIGRLIGNPQIEIV